MNSSGIKRGLAATAISALAVTGLPALATMASAAPGDAFTVTYTGPTLNGGTHGGVVILRALDGRIDESQLNLTSTSSATAGSEDNSEQVVDIASVEAPVNDETDDDYELIQVNIEVTTPAAGDTATFRIFEDDGTTDGTLEASEARQTVSLTTSGELTDIVVEPESQSTPENIASGAYTVTLKDAAGRTTQLNTGQTIAVLPEDGTVTPSDASLDATDLERGTDSFTATGTTAGTYDIVLDDSASTVEETVTLVVTEAAVLDEDDIDIVTAADSWDGPGDGFDGGTTLVRVDQNTIRFDFDAADSEGGANVQLTVDGTDDLPGDPSDGNGVTFAGDEDATYSTTLDANGDGSITITADAATVQENDEVDVDINGFEQTLEFQRAEQATIAGESDKYFCQDDGECTVTAVVTDQFGNPVTTGEVEASRTGHNTDTTPQRKPVGADGTVDFTFTDANTADGGTDVVLFEYFLDQFDNTAEDSDSGTTIEWSATGQGSDYKISLEDKDTEAADYDASDVTIDPLADSQVTTVGEAADLDVDTTEAGVSLTVTVDNGALILAPGEDELHEGSASVTAPASDFNGDSGYQIIGTKSGVVTVTVESANRTETAQLTVAAQDDASTARNVSVSGPATVEPGVEQIQFAALITDAFGNPVSGVSIANLNIQVTGPAEFQDSDALTNEDGILNLNVRVDDDAADGETVTIRVEGMGHQFGADEDQLTATSPEGAAEDLPASSHVGTASTEVNADVPPVPAALTLKGGDNGAADDSLLANAIKRTAGADVTLFRKKADGTWKKIRTGVMNAKGNFRFKDVNDRNGNKVTKYKAVVKATDDTKRGVGKKRVR